MEVIDALYGGYGDITPFGKGPDQNKIWEEGNEYLHREYPELDYFKDCAVIPRGTPEPEPVVEEVAPAAPELVSVGRGLGDAKFVESTQGVRADTSPWTLAFILSSIGLSVYVLYRYQPSKADSGKGRE